MIELNVPHRILPTGKVRGLKMGSAFHSIDRYEQEKHMMIDLRALYDDWFKENNIAYKLAVRTIPNKKDDSVILLSMIHFYDESDAMAFKLVWL